jgi:hypothetical protein
MFYKKLVHAVIDGKDLCRTPAEFRVNLILIFANSAFRRGHGYLLFASYDTAGRTLELSQG